jgi:hypothetical protein
VRKLGVRWGETMFDANRSLPVAKRACDCRPALT